MKIITCYTLFDITQTGVLNRAKPPIGQDNDQWLKQRNTQCNFDTIQQAISLRSQPEMISVPQKSEIKFNEFENFGFLYQQIEDETYPCWSFTFAIQHSSVFDDGINELGSLYNDCHGIPMIRCETQWSKLSDFLDSTDELRNIYFEIKHD